MHCGRRALKGYFHWGRGGRGGWRVLDEDVGLIPGDSISRVGSPNSQSGSHLRSVDSGTRAATGTSISSTSQQPSSRACCANSMTVTRPLPPAPSSSAASFSYVTHAPEVTPRSPGRWGISCSAGSQSRPIALFRRIPVREDERNLKKRWDPLAFCVFLPTTSCSLKLKVPNASLHFLGKMGLSS